jgi:hypothetical protein
MPVDRSVKLSISQFCELLGLEPARFIGVDVNRQSSVVTVVLEPKEDPLPAAFSVGEFADAVLRIANRGDYATRTHGPDPTGHP